MLGVQALKRKCEHHQALGCKCIESIFKKVKKIDSRI